MARLSRQRGWHWTTLPFFIVFYLILYFEIVIITLLLLLPKNNGKKTLSRNLNLKFHLIKLSRFSLFEQKPFFVIGNEIFLVETFLEKKNDLHICTTRFLNLRNLFRGFELNIVLTYFSFRRLHNHVFYLAFCWFWGYFNFNLFNFINKLLNI